MLERHRPLSIERETALIEAPSEILIRGSQNLPISFVAHDGGRNPVKGTTSHGLFGTRC
jgi:hypothetical protein